METIKETCEYIGSRMHETIVTGPKFEKTSTVPLKIHHTDTYITVYPTIAVNTNTNQIIVSTASTPYTGNYIDIETGQVVPDYTCDQLKVDVLLGAEQPEWKVFISDSLYVFLEVVTNIRRSKSALFLTGRLPSHYRIQVINAKKAEQNISVDFISGQSPIELECQLHRLKTANKIIQAIKPNDTENTIPVALFTESGGYNEPLCDVYMQGIIRESHYIKYRRSRYIDRSLVETLFKDEPDKIFTYDYSTKSWCFNPPKTSICDVLGNTLKVGDKVLIISKHGKYLEKTKVTKINKETVNTASKSAVYLNAIVKIN